MKRTFITRLLLSSWKLHSVCCVLVLLCSYPLLWPLSVPEWLTWLTNSICGNLIALAFLLSAILGVLTVCYSLFRLRYTRSMLNLLAWIFQWGITAGIWIYMALSADVPPLPAPRDTSPIQQTDDLFAPNDELKGPSSLVKKLVMPEEDNTDQLAYTPNMLKLETEHRDIFEKYLNSVPRWAYKAKFNAFYAEPGHMIFSLPVKRNTLRLVHVCFRYFEEGTELPSGFVVVSPGEAMPSPANETGPMPDLAVNLGGKHFLLIACRGMQSVQESRRVINATLRSIDARLQRLADKPTQSTIDSAVEGVRSFYGNTPEILLCEPPTQSGTYQAEVYCNPMEAGELMMIITHMKTGQVLRLFSCAARYSDDETQLFRHDFPGDIKTSDSQLKHLNKEGIMPDNIPLFTIMEGEAHSFSPVEVEIWFTPTNQKSERKLILRRCYNVQTYAPPAQPMSPDAVAEADTLTTPNTDSAPSTNATQPSDTTPTAGTSSAPDTDSKDISKLLDLPISPTSIRGRLQLNKTNSEPQKLPLEELTIPAKKHLPGTSTPAPQPKQPAAPTPAPQPEQPAAPTPTPQPERPAESTPTPQPEQTAEPAPAPQPKQPAESTPAPQPEQTAAPTPAPQPEQPAAPTPTPQPKQPAEPAPAPQPERPAESTPAPQPEQTAAPTPTPQPEQPAEPTPAPQPEQPAAPTPAPQPEQPAAPTPAPQPEQPAEPTPAPQPEQPAEPTPAPQHERPSEPAPTPQLEQPAEPTPASQPEQPAAPTPTPQPEQPAEPTPAPQPEQPAESTPAPQPEQPAASTPTPQPEQPAEPTPAPQPEQPAESTPAPQPEQPAESTPASQPEQPAEPTPAPQPEQPAAPAPAPQPEQPAAPPSEQQTPPAPSHEAASAESSL